jgi:glutaredoxin 3
LIQENKVILFSKTYCPFSKGVKKILTPYQIKSMKVVELDLRKDGRTVQEELKKITKIHTVPQLFVDNKFVGNFDMVSKLQKEDKMRTILEKAQAIPSNGH